MLSSYNKIFSILTREKGSLREVSRVFDKKEDMVGIHSALVPEGSSPFIDYAAEQLIQCLIRSYMTDAANEFDPLSRYNYPLSFPIIFESSLDALNDNIVVSYRKTEGYNTLLENKADMIIYSDSNQLSFTSGPRSGETVTYTVENDLSSIIEIDDNVTIHIKYPLTGAHPVSLSWKLPFNRTLLDIKRELPVSALSKYQYMEHTLLPDYISGIVMDVCYRQELT